ncbi:uncharacterized protein LOC117607936 [Osmia lignaria lignaria]|uniref:uncharacterized protein LOC117607936 n=1 Tax=Osmia lignaria lignaria TaxID=1437193 RepID=UPI0014786963|nr:uncharacterized protein LOC117607936 [Osmia lignaria]
MHRVQRAIRAAFLAATLIAFVRLSVADSRLSLQCKNIARDVIMNSCKGPRIKRANPRFDLEMMDDEMGKLEPTEASQDTAPSVQQQKRQFFPESVPSISGLFGGMGLPVTNIATNTFHKTEVSVPGIGYAENQDTTMVEESFVPEFPISYRPSGSYPVIRSSNPDKLLGFDLSSEELEELFYEVGDRMPRNSKDLKKKIFQTVATKCCPNPKLCYDNPSLIPCMGY